MSLQRPAALDPSIAIDEPLRQALADAKEADKPTRVSIEMRLYSPLKRAYVKWTDLSWKVDLTAIASGRRLVKGIDLLLRALEKDEGAAIEALEKVAES